MLRTNQSVTVKELIEDCIKMGMTDKLKIYTKIVNETGTPRSTVRRCAAELKSDYLKKIKILENKEPRDFYA